MFFLVLLSFGPSRHLHLIQSSPFSPAPVSMRVLDLICSKPFLLLSNKPGLLRTSPLPSPAYPCYFLISQGCNAPCFSLSGACGSSCHNPSMMLFAGLFLFCIYFSFSIVVVNSFGFLSPFCFGEAVGVTLYFNFCFRL
jgi:hypothetical protein